MPSTGSPSTTPSSSSSSFGWLFLRPGKSRAYQIYKLLHLHRLTHNRSGAQIVFRSFLQPLFARFFENQGSTSANLRGQADKVSGKVQ